MAGQRRRREQQHRNHCGQRPKEEKCRRRTQDPVQAEGITLPLPSRSTPAYPRDAEVPSPHQSADGLMSFIRSCEKTDESSCVFHFLSEGYHSHSREHLCGRRRHFPLGSIADLSKRLVNQAMSTVPIWSSTTWLDVRPERHGPRVGNGRPPTLPGAGRATWRHRRGGPTRPRRRPADPRRDG